MATHATPVEVSETEEVLRNARNATLLLVQECLVRTLYLQARAEGRSIGEVIDSMLREYLEAHGDQSVIDYLNQLSGENGTS